MAGSKGSEIRVAGTGRILVADLNKPAPATIDATWGPDWVDLGYTTTDGIKFNKKDKIDPVDTWQSVSPARFIFSDRDLTVKFQLLQMNKDTLSFFMGGDKATPLAGSPAPADQFSFGLQSSPKQDERQLGIEFVDGKDITYRFVIPRGQVTETEEIALTRTGAIKLGVTFTALAVEDGKTPLATILMKDKAYA
ncbi:phage tail tube protein [Streptomyces albireticuli]|uniref:Phage tail protein n=1 Tax=Streptomyces albireticuli TaxID=1940 RepID=A0A2A2D253_9ACTN|nr:phage tail protein [Streptomyces albireticuli]MCD9145172.1 phage tail protein [Streptomyces albireticuli]MCD9164653.1 phage tail protein [Streptomyces albireticuli]MCD9194918.1 phage tail protein [Streptomyces albireticuli]PAU45410.1 phage tail protein [Streptomyces albireticuli]